MQALSENGREKGFRSYLDLEHHSSSLEEEHFVDTLHFEYVDTWAD